MSLPERVTHEFVEFIPSGREFGRIYISIPYATAVHDCLCGCGMKVVTPIKPNKWTLTFDGEAISLSPSIGNWSFLCRSHYWIRGNEVISAGQMSKHAIEIGRVRDGVLTEQYYAGRDYPTGNEGVIESSDHHAGAEVKSAKPSFWRKLFESLVVR